MFCKKCGSEMIDGATFCQKCGTKAVYENVQYTPSANTDGAKKDTASHTIENIGRVLKYGAMALLFLLSFFKIPIIIGVVLVAVAAVGIILSVVGSRRHLGLNKIIELIVGVVLLAVVVFYVLSSGGTGDKYIQIVKNGTLDAYPQMTVGEAFDGYLDNPKWESGLSEDKQRFVNVKGGILYYEKEAEIVVQFIVNEKDGSFQYNACEVNGLPQNNLVVWGLLENIYGTQSTDEQNLVGASSVPNTPVYDVDELGYLLGTRSVYLYDEYGILSGKYDQCESIKIDDKYGVRYGDLTILSAESGDIMQISTTNPKTFQKNGISLDKSYAELVDILGEAMLAYEDEQGNWYSFESGAVGSEGGYINYSISVGYHDPAQKPFEVFIEY